MAPPRQNCLKAFLNRHGHWVDFVSASCIICICLIVLLPKVHESFLTEEFHAQAHHHKHNIISKPETTTKNDDSGQQETGLSSAIGVNQPIIKPPPPASTNQQQQPLIVIQTESSDSHMHHDHNHKFPIGEVLICIGFFVFYCIGLSAGFPDGDDATFASLRRPATECCSSSRCPTGQQRQQMRCSTSEPNTGQDGQAEELSSEQTTILADERPSPADQDEGCLLFLNRHHNHHTHPHHHDHQTTATTTTTAKLGPANTITMGTKKPNRLDYGTMTTNDGHVLARGAYLRDEHNLAFNQHKHAKPATTIVVDEIRISSVPCEEPSFNWPLSLKMLIFSLLLAVFLIFFDMNVSGLIKAIKVFRAASTGALLYVAFFIMLPRRPVGCNSCKEEQRIS